jgi:drug/metabolite transporter (DMT)-like permease
MNKNFVASVVALFVVSMALGFVVHGVLLGADYAKLQGIFRTPEDSEKHFLAMLAAHLFIALGFTWIYRHGRDPAKPALGQGVRFGLAVAVLTTIPTYLIYYAVTPMPSDVVAKQIAFDVVAMVIMGIVAALVNRDYPVVRIPEPAVMRA